MNDGPAAPWGDAAALLAPDWLTLAERLLERQKHGDSRFSLLQRCGLWLEHAWYAAHAGRLDSAAQSLARVDAEGRLLPPSDKAFFSEERACLPLELTGR
jgi:hypothetical protein